MRMPEFVILDEDYEFLAAGETEPATVKAGEEAMAGDADEGAWYGVYKLVKRYRTESLGIRFKPIK